MKQKLIEKTTQLCNNAEQLKELWMDYVRQQGEVDLDGRYITMWDGSGERMSRLTHHDGCVYVVDIFGCEWDFSMDVGPETLIELHDVVFADKSSSEE